MSFLHDQISENIHTTDVSDLICELAKDGEGCVFVSLVQDSRSFFTLTQLKEEQEEEYDEEVNTMIEDIENKSDTDRLVYVLDHNMKVHKFIV